MTTSIVPTAVPTSGSKYRPILEIGQGGMSRVYLAVAQGAGGFQKLQVVKRLLPDLANDPEFLAMFLEEARLSARLNHSNVVQINEVGFDGRHYFMAMEYLEGQSVESLVRRAAKSEALPTEIYLKVIAEAASGLHYAHELVDIDGKPLNIVHRDISPHNVFVTYQGQVKVLDFGIAKAADSSQHTRTGVLKGKVAYMAPEQFSNAKGVDRRADIFALGVMAFQGAAQTRLWKGLAEMEILQKLATKDIPKIADVAPGVPERLQAIIGKATAAEPSDRYNTAQELADALEEYLEEMKLTKSQKEIGRYVTQLFADTKAKVGAQVETALRAVQQRADASPNSTNEIPALSESQQLPMQQTSTGSTGAGTQRLDAEVAELAKQSYSQLPSPPSSQLDFSGNTQASRVQSQGASRVGLYAALFFGAAAIAAAAFVLLRPPSVTPQPPGQPSSTVATVDSTPQTPGKFTSLTVEASPSNARLFVDDIALGANPGKARLPKDGRTHVIRAEAPGFLTEVQSIGFDSDEKLVSFMLSTKEKPVPVGQPSSKHPTTNGGHDVPTANTGTTPPTAATTATPPTAATTAAPPTATTAAPPTAVTPSVAPGTIEPKAVRGVVVAHQGEVQDCYDRARMNQTDLKGRVTVAAQIAPNGSVITANIANSTANSGKLENCLVGAFRRWTFPAPSGGVAGNVSYSFRFEE